MKICTKCLITKDESEFYRKHSECKICFGKRTRERRKKHSQKYAEYAREWGKKHPEARYLIRLRTTLRIKYGMTYSQYLEILRNQGNKCAVCDCNLVKPCIDHDHMTGKFRGLLCRSCNLALGFLQDNPEFCYMAAEYLLRHKSIEVIQK